MKSRLLIPAAALLAVLAACKSSSPEVPCRCGTPIADIEGCSHADCLSGKGNSDNPDCMCGGIDIPAHKN